MMIRIITSILIFLVCSNSIAQPNYTALITDPQIGPDANADKLIEVVDDINNRDSISLVVVMGNITANGKLDEFLWAQEILDGLAAPYFVVGGEKDYLLSEGKGNEIALLWGDDKFWFEKDNEVHIVLNSFGLKTFNKGYIDIETLNWLSQKLHSIERKNIFFYLYNIFPIELQNWLAFYNSWRSRFRIFQVSVLKKRSKVGRLYEAESLSTANNWFYNFIQNKSDSVFIYQVEDSKQLPSLKLKISKLKHLPQGPGFYSTLRETIIKDSLIWKKKLGEVIHSNSLIQGNKIYTVTSNGNLYCIGNEGNEIWKYETNGTIYSSPKVEKDLVVAATNEGDLFTINANNGNLFQVIGIGETITSEIELVDIEHNGMQTKGICFGTAEGNFYCYELYSLELIWWNNGIKEMINSSVIMAKGKVIFQDRKGTLYCLNSQSGVLLWKWKTNTKIFNPLFKSDIIIKDNNIYFIDYDGDLHCIDALLGTKKWSIRKIIATGIIKLNKKKNELILHSAKNKILVVSFAKRKVNIEFILPDRLKDEIATDIELIDDKLIAGFTNGTVYQLMEKQVPKNIFWQSSAPIVSLNEINANILVTDYDGNLTLLDLSEKKK